MSVNGNLAKNLWLRWLQARGEPITLILLSGHQTAFSMLSCSFQHLSEKFLQWKAVNRVNAIGQSPEKSGGHLYPQAQAKERIGRTTVK